MEDKKISLEEFEAAEERQQLEAYIKEQELNLIHLLEYLEIYSEGTAHLLQTDKKTVEAWRDGKAPIPRLVNVQLFFYVHSLASAIDQEVSQGTHIEQEVFNVIADRLLLAEVLIEKFQEIILETTTEEERAYAMELVKKRIAAAGNFEKLMRECTEISQSQGKSQEKQNTLH